MPQPANALRRAMLKVRAIFFRRALENDMQAEMREHLELATDRYIARGMSEADARRAARREFGNVAVLQEEARDARGARWVGALAGVGGALALLLASLGLYGVVSLAVRQRTREIGIRIAVGAHPQRVARMFLASGVRVSLVALALGLPLSLAALKIGLSQGLVIAPGVNTYLIGGVIALVLLAVASAATWVPARRAALVDPASTLRVE